MAVFLCLSLPLQAFLLQAPLHHHLVGDIPHYPDTDWNPLLIPGFFPNVADPNIRAIPFSHPITNGIFFIFLHGGINDMLHLSPIPGINTVHDQITGRLLKFAVFIP